MGEHSKALPFYERAVNIGQQSLPPNHPHFQWYRKNLNRLEKKLLLLFCFFFVEKKNKMIK
jgi:hypothetical protein